MVKHEKKSRPKRERPTVGQIVYKNLADRPESYDPVEMQRAMERSTCANLQECIERNRKLADHFYIVYLLRWEHLLPGALRGYFIARRTRPDPDWDMSLFEYDVPSDKLTYHWTLPDKATGLMMLSQPSKVPDHAKELLGFVTKFHNKELV